MQESRGYLNDNKTTVIKPIFTGHSYDSILGIYFAGARFYDAGNRQWMSMDPIKDGGNWYQYCYSNPATYIDPLGLEGFSPFGCGLNELKGQFDEACSDIKDWARVGKGVIEALGATALVAIGITAIAATGGAALPVVLGSFSSTAILWGTQVSSTYGLAAQSVGLKELAGNWNGSGSAGAFEGGTSTLNDWVSRIPELSKQAPIEIPSSATIKVQAKNGYDQISFKWTENGQNYEVRWHTKTPGAPEGQGNTWVVSQVTPGTPTGQVRTEHILVGDTWIPRYQWQDAINAYRNGTATQEQLQLLKDGHWQAP